MGRWLEVITAFTRQDVWGVRELAQATGLPRSSAHRILHEMSRLHLLANGPDGQFELGPVLTRLAVVLSGRLDIVRIARPVLQSTMEATGETTVLALYTPERKQVWAVDAIETEHPVRFIWDSLPDWRDLHVGATGKGILAFLPDLERHAVIDSLPDPIVSARSVSKKQLHAQIAEARRDGYVISRGESFPGAIAVASPIRAASGSLVGDIVVSWPDSRSSTARELMIGKAAFAAASAVSRGLGFVGDIRTGDGGLNART